MNHVPRSMVPTGHSGREDAAGPVVRGHETILLVDDEPMVLNLAASVLQRRGYRVVAANTPGEAIRLAKAYDGQIQLLLTDVVMPDMDGYALAKQLLVICPHVKCLFMSGYTADRFAHHGVLDDAARFLQKPFTIDGLAGKVRDVLDTESGPRGRASSAS